MCANDGHLFVGVDTGAEADGVFNDFVLEYDITGAQPQLLGGKPLLFPVPSSLHAICGLSIFGTTIQADSFDREKVRARPASPTFALARCTPFAALPLSHPCSLLPFPRLLRP